jgi:hypothetical protein
LPELAKERFRKGSLFSLFIVAVPVFGQSSIPAGARYWASDGRFAGSAKCALCHPSEAAMYAASSMSRALEPVESCAILRGAIHYSFKDGDYSYSITRDGTNVIYTVTNGKERFTAPLEYAFGRGKAGQTYVYSSGGHYYESRVSYYSEISNLDLTVGAVSTRPPDLTSAAGRLMAVNEPRDCFGCHTTGARIGGTLQLKDFEPGVQCESCHGPGANHVEAVSAGKPITGTIRALGNMSPDQSNEFCGTCHRTFQTVAAMGIKGINTARFPAYRITSSPCFSLDDRRIACTSCHDPHGGLVSDDKYYDSKCISCHNNSAGKNAVGKVCPVATQSCTSCHMQRVSPPQAHHAFPDHWFRIVHSKDDYPE